MKNKQKVNSVITQVNEFTRIAKKMGKPVVLGDMIVGNENGEVFITKESFEVNKICKMMK